MQCDGPATVTEYNRTQIEEALDVFLEGIAADEEISIRYDPTL
jgi:hypothetical protein